MRFEDEPLDVFPENEQSSHVNGALDRVRLPAICLIMVGVLNIVGGLFWAFIGVSGFLEFNKQAEVEIAQKFNLPQNEPQTDRIVNISYICLSAISIFTATFTILGGIRMVSLKSYKLAILGSVLAAIPCVSALGCCGIGEGVAIWSLVVLVRPDVRSGFR
jgi:hypothetical protein